MGDSHFNHSLLLPRIFSSGQTFHRAPARNHHVRHGHDAPVRGFQNRFRQTRGDPHRSDSSIRHYAGSRSRSGLAPASVPGNRGRHGARGIVPRRNGFECDGLSFQRQCRPLHCHDLRLHLARSGPDALAHLSIRPAMAARASGGALHHDYENHSDSGIARLARETLPPQMGGKSSALHAFHFHVSDHDHYRLYRRP